MTIPQSIAKARSLDRRTASLAEYRRLFDLIATGYICCTLKPSRGLWYRIRPNRGQTFFGSIKELWYPPAEQVKLGRANDPGNPVLYLSEHGAVALREVPFVSGDWLTVLTCQVRHAADLNLQEIGLREYARKPNLLNLAREIDRGLVEAHRHGIGDPIHYALVRNYLVEEFTRTVCPGNEHEYKPSAAIAALLMNYSECDGLAYPAIKSAKLDCNIALKAASADRKLEVVAVDVVQAQRHTGDEIFVTRLATSSEFSADGSIIYRDARGQTKELSWIDPNSPRTDQPLLQ